MIAVVDYGMGNLRSVQKAFEFIGCEAKITDRAADLRNASHIVLPGVGAFKDAIAALESSGMSEAVKREAKEGKPFLGICLGMQMLFDKSYEDGVHSGLGLVQGEVVKFQVDLKVPHIGWNKLLLKKQTPLFTGVEDMDFYFVHSYHASGCRVEDIETVCEYGYEFVASINKDNLYGVQFHPEKSGDTGLKLLSNFAKLR